MKKTDKSNFKIPKRLKNQDGEIRKVGFELEFANLGLQKVVDIIINIFGGTCDDIDPFKREITGTSYGNFTVEIDARILKERKYEEYLQSLGIEINQIFNRKSLENFIADTAAFVVPIEIVTPPIPLNDLSKIEELRQALFIHKADGTKTSFIYAFGLHINPEVPCLDSFVLLQYLRAFLLLYDWIVEKAEIDLTRRLTSYINPFQDDYIKLVLNSSYKPDIQSLMTDYLEFNPTRNRPLDLTPLFAFIDEKLVLKNVAEKKLIKGRRAFHYRLPNCLVDQKNWTISQEWNLWAAVEELANQPEQIEEMSQDYLQTKNSFRNYITNEWSKRLEKWLG